MKRRDEVLPTVEEILAVFPTWNHALIEAGLEPVPASENTRLDAHGKVVKVEGGEPS